jgi:hypothetical protein
MASDSRKIVHYRCPRCKHVLEREVGQDVPSRIPRTLRSFCAVAGREVTLQRVPRSAELYQIAASAR